MKPIITVSERELRDKDMIKLRLENLGRTKESGDVVAFVPKAKKATEVIRLLRENGIEYQITFGDSLN